MRIFAVYGKILNEYIEKEYNLYKLLARGYNVDVGVIEIREGDARKQLEVDFVSNQGNKRYYVQVALNLDTPEKNYKKQNH